MLKFSLQANEDLSQVLAGLISFRISGASIPALTQEHAESIFNEITDQISTIPNQPLHLRNNFEGLGCYGEFLFTYKRNRTSWYAFYDKEGDDFIVNRISNNWNILLPKAYDTTI